MSKRNPIKTTSFLVLALLLGLASCQQQAATDTEEKHSSRLDGDTLVQRNIDSLSRKINQKPTVALYVERAALHERRKEYTLALDDISKAAELDSTQPQLYIKAARLLQEMPAPSFSKAATAYEKALLLDPKNAQAWLELGRVRYFLRHYEESMKNLDASVKIDPNQPEAFYYIGRNFYELGSDPDKKCPDCLDKAILHLSRAANLKPSLVEAWMLLGYLYSEYRNDINRARAAYANAVDYASTENLRLRALYARGKFWQELDSFRLAIADYNSIIAMKGEFLTTNHNLGWVYLEQGMPDSAVKYFTRSAQMNPAFPETYEYRAQAYDKLGKKDSARADREEVEHLRAGGEPRMYRMF